MNMTLVVLHYHLRPGGIRRVIEVATPHLLHHPNAQIVRVIVASGEAPDATWRRLFEERAAPIPVAFFVDKSFGYLSEQKGSAKTLTRRVRDGLDRLMTGCASGASVVWAHNLAIGRNLILSRELVRACERHDVNLLSHHHDWWFDNRWQRWSELRRLGFRTLASAATAVFPGSSRVRHAAINRADAGLLKRHLGSRVSWLPNLAERGSLPPRERVQIARGWLSRQVGSPKAPVWILPCRLLRRKNVAEAMLLTRWLRPDAWLVTTGGVSSAEEAAYGRRLAEFAQEQPWRLRLGVLAGDEARKPTVGELMAASECVLLTSIQEGFGLPYLEAASAERPLIARELPNIAPDLRVFGLKFPQSYAELMVPPDLFDWAAEVSRQRQLYVAWKRRLPLSCRALVAMPVAFRPRRSRRPVAFSRLTLTAQFEILSKPPQESWDRCVALNPFLEIWRERATRGRLECSGWPSQADDWLSGSAYARNWIHSATLGNRAGLDVSAAIAAQKDYMVRKLSAEYVYPQLWSSES